MDKKRAFLFLKRTQYTKCICSQSLEMYLILQKTNIAIRCDGFLIKSIQRSFIMTNLSHPPLNQNPMLVCLS